MRIFRSLIRPLACLLATAAALPVAAQIYSWRDTNGKMHYSDVPPASGEATVLRANALPAAPAANAEPGDKAAQAAPPADKPKTLAERELEFRQRRAQAAEAEAKAEQEQTAAAQRTAECERARNQLAALKSGQRMATYDAQGERVVLDDQRRAQEIERMGQLVDARCK